MPRNLIDNREKNIAWSRRPEYGAVCAEAHRGGRDEFTRQLFESIGEV